MRSGMTEHPSPAVPGELVAEEPGRFGGAAGSWPELGRLLADRRSSEATQDVDRLRSVSQPAPHIAIALRSSDGTISDSLL